MSFSLNADGITIEQDAGTIDTSLASLANLQSGGVNIATKIVGYNCDTYIVPDPYVLSVQGYLTITVGSEHLILANATQVNNKQELRVESGGILSINGETNGLYNVATFLTITRQTATSSNPSQGVMYVQSGASLYWNGGTMQCGSVIALYGTDLNLNNGYVNGQSGDMFRIFNEPAAFNNFTVRKNRVVLNFTGATFEGFGLVDNLIEGLENNTFVNLKNIGSSAVSWLRNNLTRFFVNPQDGMNTFIRKFTSSPSQYGGCITLTKQVVVKCLDENKAAIDGAKVVINTYDDGNRIDYTINPDEGYGAFSNFPTVTRTSLTTAVTGLTTQSEILMKAFAARPTQAQNDFNTMRFSKGATDDANFDITSVLYGKQITTNETSLNGNGLLTTTQNMLPDTSITEADKSVVDAYPYIATPYQFYDRAMSILVDGFVNETAPFVTRSGNTIDLGSADLSIDVIGLVLARTNGNWSMNTYLFYGNITTTGTVTYLNGAKVDGIVTDSTGTTYPPLNISITNISAGSRLLITNETTASEVFNDVIAGTSYAAQYPEGTGYSAGDVIRVKITKTDGVTAKLGYESNVVATALGWSMLVAQEDDSVYNTMAVDGSLITDFTADYVNNQIDLIISSNFNLSELYAWWAYNLTTESGIRNFFGGITALDTANFRVNVGIIDLYLDSTVNVSVHQLDNRRFYRSDEVYPVNVPTTSGYGLDVVWRNTVLVTGLSPAQETKLYSLDTTNLDAAVSTRSTFNNAADEVITDTASRDGSKGLTTDEGTKLTNINTVTKLIPATL